MPSNLVLIHAGRSAIKFVSLKSNSNLKKFIQKWITNGTYADYFTVGCRTDKGGLVVVVIPRGEGVETKPIRTSYSTAAGTAFVTFDNVWVPYENTLGPDNGGLQVILSNFNHERSVLQ